MTASLESMSKLPNAYLRVSSTSLGPYSDLSDQERVLFRRVIEAFTPQRIMWGSNFASSRDGGYIAQVELGQTALPWLSTGDREWIMSKSAQQLWPMLKPE